MAGSQPLGEREGGADEAAPSKSPATLFFRFRIKCRNDLRQQRVFRFLNTRVQSFWRIIRKNRNCGLPQDFAGVHTTVNKVHGAPCDFLTGLQGLSPSG